MTMRTIQSVELLKRFLAEKGYDWKVGIEGTWEFTNIFVKSTPIERWLLDKFDELGFILHSIVYMKEFGMIITLRYQEHR